MLKRRKAVHAKNMSRFFLSRRIKTVKFFRNYLTLNTGKDFIDPLICVIMVTKELDDYAIRFSVTGKSICFICVNMHGKPEVPVYSDDNIGIDQSTAIAFGQDKYFIIVLKT